jgi:2-C-methyl-D-erythritol 4-phosphate cytidylyltransferase
VVEGIFCADVDVVIVAAGSGRRMRQAVRKQWLEIQGQPLFVHVCVRFARFGCDSFVIVSHPDELRQVHEAVQAAGLPARVRVTSGGTTRQSSVWAGLQCTSRPWVAIHDAARPFVRYQDFEAVVCAARRAGAATLGQPAHDTLKRVSTESDRHEGTQDNAKDVAAEPETARIAGTIDRSAIWQVQTPQVFARSLLVAAHEHARAQGLEATDDSALVEQAGHAVVAVRGSHWNIKITEPDDLLWLKAVEAIACEWD